MFVVPPAAGNKLFSHLFLLQELFVSPARLIVRKPGQWYVPGRPGVWSP